MNYHHIYFVHQDMKLYIGAYGYCMNIDSLNSEIFWGLIWNQWNEQSIWAKCKDFQKLENKNEQNLYILQLPIIDKFKMNNCIMNFKLVHNIQIGVFTAKKRPTCTIISVPDKWFKMKLKDIDIESLQYWFVFWFWY